MFHNASGWKNIYGMALKIDMAESDKDDEFAVMDTIIIGGFAAKR